jgi:small subunit ribosomal protein S4
MARYLGPKCRLCRAAGTKLFLKAERCYSPKCPLERKGAVPPGQHGQKKKGGVRLSKYGEQLAEKQKLKRIYGVLEKQFRRYFSQALKAKGETGKTLLQLLERRLDNVVYRLGFAPSRSVARQLVRHGHVLVNNKRVNIPSYQVRPGEIISLAPKALKMEVVSKALEEKERKIPSWLQRKAAVGKINRLPERGDIDFDINEDLIVEFYSR